MKRLILFCLPALFLLTKGHCQVGFQSHVVIDNTNGIYGTKAFVAVDLDKDGDKDVVYVDGTIGWFENSNGQDSFSSRNIISSTVESSSAVAVSDLDGDGYLDVISTTGTRYGRIIWFRHLDGKGNFGAPQEIFGVDTPKGVFSADLDGDGDMDVLSASRQDSKIAWYKNLDGQGNFGSQLILTETASGALDVYAADLDGDGDLDVLSASSGDDKISWFENTDGNGNFGVRQDISDLMDGALSVRTADMDGDGDLDVLSVSSSDGKIAWYENMDGQANFGTQQILKEDDSNGARSVTASDIDGDGDTDVVSTTVNAIFWFENTDGQGTFGSEQLISNNLVGTQLVVATDVDGDNDIDLLSSSTSDNRIAWHENLNGQGNFGIQQTMAVKAFNAHSVFPSDIDGDGDIDLVTATKKDSNPSSDDGTVAWHENIDGKGDYSMPKIISRNAVNVESAHAADLDGDGDMDVVRAAYNTGNAVAWHENIDGKGNFGELKIVNTSRTATFVYVADVNNDGFQDIITSNRDRGEIYWYQNMDGNGNFGFGTLVSSYASGAEGITAMDLDGDGDMDLLCALSYDDRVAWYENTDGTGQTFTRYYVSTNLDEVSSARAADMDGDGDLDVISASYRDSKIVFSKNNDGQATFDAPQVLSTELGTASLIYPADIDNDGDLDIVAASRNYDTMAWLENLDGLANFGALQIIATDIETPRSINVADVDGDGNIDLLSASSDDSKIAWYQNLGKLGNTIRGAVRLDLDANGCDSSDLPMANLMVVANNGINSFATFTNDNGNYQIPTIEGNFVTAITTSLPAYYAPNPNEHNSVFTGDGNAATADFCLSENLTINDVNISFFPINEARPGFDVTYRIVYGNIGTSRLSGNIVLEYDDDKLNLLSADAPVASQTKGVLSFDYVDLNPLEKRTIEITFTIPAPPEVNINDILPFTATINPVVGDYTKEDNQYQLYQTVIGSYDPNDITVLEGDELLFNASDNYLHYIIRFQNTGTASAINVKVNTVLNPNLDFSTLQIEGSSHTKRVEIRDGNIVSFYYDDINLPDSYADESNSHGFIAYKIKPKENIQVGDVITGQANIYFDFNPAIVTNGVATEIIADDVEDLVAEATQTTSISCNGATDATIQIDAVGGTVPYTYELLDENDNVLSTQTSNIFTNLGPGTYNTKVRDDAVEESYGNTIIISEPDPLQFSANVTPITCKGLNNGTISMNGSGGVSPYEYSIDGSTYVTNNKFTDLMPATYSINIRDASGCTYTTQGVIAEPNSPDFDSDGIGDPCDDDVDGDGVSNENDECANTVLGGFINSLGCNSFELSSTNFTIQTTGETCSNSDNGNIRITAIENLSYTATITNGKVSTSKEFRSFAVFQDLSAGTYEICMTVEDYPEYEKCFAVQISEPANLSVDSKIDPSGKLVALKLKGGANYHINLNGINYQTSESEITLPLSQSENKISVQTDVDCQGVYEDMLMLNYGLSVYPNPVKNGETTIFIADDSQGTIELSLFDNTMKLVKEKQQELKNGSVTLNMEGLATGFYVLRISTANEIYMRKIIKE